MTPAPHFELPRDQLPDGIFRYHAIPPVAMILRPADGPAESVETDRSNVAFAALRRAAREHLEIVRLSVAGHDLDADSLAALNSFVRAQDAMGNMRHPWDRLPNTSTADTRFDWSGLAHHLGLRFAP